MGHDRLLNQNLHWDQRKRNQIFSLNALQDLHALLALNLFGGHVLASTLEQRGWLVLHLFNFFFFSKQKHYINFYYYLSYFTQHCCLLTLFLLWNFVFAGGGGSLLVVSHFRWYAQIEHSFPVKICVGMLFLVVITIVPNLAMLWRVCPHDHWFNIKEASLVKSVIFLVKRC